MNSFRRTLRARRAHRRAHGTAASAPGFSLPEVLIAVTVSGILVASIATAFSVVIRSTPIIEARLSESKDVTFLQAWIPIDLSTAINSYDDIDDVELKNKLTSNEPNVSYLADLDGTNVLTLVVPDPSSNTLQIVAYRYIFENGEGRLVRYRIESPGQAGAEVVSLVGVAYEVAQPDPTSNWQAGDPVDFAFAIEARNQASLRPVGEDITVLFQSGNEFRTGGAGLSAEKNLTPNDPVTLPDPTAPPTRCGGRVALVLDTSYSVPRSNGGAALETAATGFLDAFTGTPTDVTILGFDQIAYQLYPNLNGIRGEYFSLLDSTADLDGNGNPDVDDAKGNITALPDLDTTTAQSGSYYYGTGNAAVGWTQRRTPEVGTVPWQGGTNWEDALHAPFFDQGGTIRSQTPELVVWVTDGDPNRQRVTDFGGTETVSDLQAAVNAANAGRSTGSRVIGVLVGPSNPDREQRIADVVGANRWTGTGPDDIGNAVAADYFASDFSQLGAVLRSIMAAECGGTVTMRKQLTDGSTPTTGKWNYSTETGDQVLDASATKSVTFDFQFGAGDSTKTVVIREEVLAGYSFVRADCEVNGTPIIDPLIITQSPGGVPGVELVIEPDQAVSCVMVSA